jgi:two-component system sensor histidine kinase CpxA
VLVLQEDATAPGARSFLHATLPIQLFRAIAIVLIIGAVCFALARYMTNPISRLRRVTGELADGNLDARVAGNFVNRRDELGDLSRDFNFMAERIETLVLSQRRLTSDISHELRSPLARLSVALGLARRSRGPDFNRYLDRIERETERLNELIGNLLKLARLESGVEPQEFEVLDLDALVREVVDDVGFEAQSRNRAVHILHADQCRAAGRWELLRSAVENVVRNAVIHTAENTVVEITLAIAPDHPADLAIIRVRDHGPGVPAHLLREIFQPFYRVDEARERSVGGTGLGLAITEHAVSFHQGQIHAENSSQGGLIVEIRLPLINSDKSALTS